MRALSSVTAQLGGMAAMTWLVPTLLLAFVAVLASYLPARKAIRIDPVQAMRCE